MDWLQSLLWDPSSVAHIVFLYAFVVAAGVYLGKIKIFGVSLGVTFVLFAGILMGHFGFTADTHILHFIREFGLILFVFCIGLQVGPSFFSSFKKGGMTLNLLAVGIVVLNIAVALGLYYLWNGRVELPMMVGILYGAVTNTPGLGAANEALNQLSYNGPQIALGYACAYPLGVVGIIGSIIAIRYIFRVNMTKEEESLKTQSGDAHHKPHMMSLEVRNESISGKTLIEIKRISGTQLCLLPYSSRRTRKYSEPRNDIQYGRPIVYCLFGRRCSRHHRIYRKRSRTGLGEAGSSDGFPAVFWLLNRKLTEKRSVPCTSVVCMVST